MIYFSGAGFFRIFISGFVRPIKVLWEVLLRNVFFILWRVKMLLIFEWGLPNGDLISDFLAGYTYILAGHVKWGACIISLMFGPLVLISLHVLCKNLYRWYQEGCQPKTEIDGMKKLKMFQKEWWKKKKWTTLKILAQVPFMMPFIHGYFLYSLSQLKKSMIECKEIYKKVRAAYDSGSKKSNEEKEWDKQEVKKAADNFVKARTEYNKITCIFQQIRLFEILGESGPQAATQIAIALRVGYVGPFQIVSILASLSSLAIGATKTLLLYPTAETKIQQQNKKPVSPKHVGLLFIPAMLLCCAPRLLCLGVELAYLKIWSVPFLIGLVLISWIINVYYGRKDPLLTLFGVMTNLFAPCILIKDRSNFLKASNITTIILQCLSILGIMTAIGLEMSWISPTPDNPPIIHCFNISNKTTNWPTNSWITAMARCRSNDCFSLSDKIDGDRFVTHCNGIPAWLPLGIVGGVLIVLLLLGIPLTFLLHYRSDPVGLLVASKKRLFHFCPKYRPQVWDEDYSEFTIPVLSIMNTNRDEIRAKMEAEGFDMSLDKLITKQLLDEEDEDWWLDNKRMGRFHKLYNQLIAILSTAWKNKGQILASMKKCFCLPFEYCIRKANRQRNNEAQEPTHPPQIAGDSSVVLPTAIQNQPDQPDNPRLQLQGQGTDLITEDSAEDQLNKLTLRDMIYFACVINSRVLLEKIESLSKQQFRKELERIEREHHEALGQTKQGESVYILQVNCGDKTDEENEKFCTLLGLTGAVENWRSIIQIKQRGESNKPYQRSHAVAWS